MLSSTEFHVANAPGPGVRHLQWASLTLLTMLIALCLAWELWLAPTGRGTLALKVLPLCLALPGMRRHRMYTFRWLSLLVWLYFGEGVLRAASDQGLSRVLAMGEVALTLALFACSTLYIRRRLRSAPLQAEV